MKSMRRGYYPGAEGKVCNPHKAGVLPGMPPFFAPECPRCQQKLAEGKATGTEPHPSVVSMPFALKRRRSWSLSVSTEGIARREGVAAARAHRKVVYP